MKEGGRNSMKIRKIEEKDLQNRVIWMNNPKIYESMHYDIPVSYENTLRWYHNNKDNQSRCDMVFENANGEVVAMGGLTSIDPNIKKAEFYIFVDPLRQGQGIGAEASTILCKYGFGKFNLKKIYLQTNKSNMGARKMYEKIGFKLEGILRSEAIVCGVYEDRLYYGIMADELS